MRKRCKGSLPVNKRYEISGRKRRKEGRLYRDYIKRGMDIAMALSGIVILSPVMLLTAFLVRTRLGSPVIFKQKRPGKDGKIFELYKFRSMTDKRDENGELLPDEVRLTAFGRKLRSTSLDELPELFNILKGDMSVVGPRPLLVDYLPLYSKRQSHRHDVRPGLTGLAQVKGRNAIGWEERFEWDLRYVRGVSLGLDLYVLARQSRRCLKGKGYTRKGVRRWRGLKAEENEYSDSWSRRSRQGGFRYSESSPKRTGGSGRDRILG